MFLLKLISNLLELHYIQPITRQGSFILQDGIDKLFSVIMGLLYILRIKE